MLGIGLVGHDRVPEEPEPGLLVRADRIRVLDRRADDALGHVVRLEEDVAQEGPNELRTVAPADEVGLADEQIDAGGADVERECLAVVVVVVDPVALDEPDGPAAIADEEQPGRILIVATDPAAVLLELVVGGGLARWIRPPTADVRLEEPLADLGEVRLGQRREVVFRRTGRGRAA